MRINIILNGITDPLPVTAYIQTILHDSLGTVAERIAHLDFTVEQPASLSGSGPERARCRISACLTDGQCARAERHGPAWREAVHRAGDDLRAVLAWSREQAGRIAAGNAVIAVQQRSALATVT